VTRCGASSSADRGWTTAPYADLARRRSVPAIKRKRLLAAGNLSIAIVAATPWAERRSAVRCVAPRPDDPHLAGPCGFAHETREGRRCRPARGCVGRLHPCGSDSDIEADPAGGVADRGPATDGAGRAVDPGEQAVTGELLVMTRESPAPPTSWPQSSRLRAEPA
jgi:hypothetical protein